MLRNSLARALGLFARELCCEEGLFLGGSAGHVRGLVVSAGWGTGRRSNEWKAWERTPFGTSSARAALVEFPLAQTGEGIAECEILKWFVKEGQHVSRFEKVCEVQSDKAAMEITSPYDGLIKQVHHDVGDVVKVGNCLLTIESGDVEEDQAVKSMEDTADRKSSHQGKPSAPSEHLTDEAPLVLAAPAVRAFAKKEKVDLLELTGSGPAGRILKEDIVAFLNLQKGGMKANTEDVQASPETVRKPIRGYRRAMVKSMTIAATIPHFHLCDDIAMTALASMKAALENDIHVLNTKLTFLPVILKAISVALYKFPDINSSLSPNESEILQHQNHNIGVAMATPDGLVVPNVKQVEKKSIGDIAIELGELRKKAMEGSLTSGDVSGGTLTVSNIGTIGGTYASPLVNPPEVAIVALGKIRRVPVIPGQAGDGSVSEEAIMPVTWAADHRVVDGAMLAGFNNAWKRLLERPERLLLHLR